MPNLVQHQEINIARFIAGAALDAYSQPVEASVKEDLSDVTNVDIAINTGFEQLIDGLDLEKDHQIVGEESDPHNTGRGNLFVIDPIDGTSSFKNGLLDWAVACTQFLYALAVFSVASTWSLQARFRGRDGVFDTTYADIRQSRGVTLLSTNGKNYISPLETNRGRYAHEIEVPRLYKATINGNSILLSNQHVRLPTGCNLVSGMRVFTVGSTINGQLQVILGLVEAFLMDADAATRERLGPYYPQIKLWDLLPAAVYNAGLVYVIVSGEREGEILKADGILSLCDENFYITEQLLVCHQDNAADILRRIAALKARLK